MVIDKTSQCGIELWAVTGGEGMEAEAGGPQQRGSGIGTPQQAHGGSTALAPEQMGQLVEGHEGCMEYNRR